MTSAEDLVALRIELEQLLRFYRTKAPVILEAENYLKLTRSLDQKREDYERDCRQKKWPSSTCETVGDMTKTMRKFSERLMDMAQLRELYIPPDSSGHLKGAKSDLAALRKSHTKVEQRLEDLIDKVSAAADSIARSPGAVNSNQRADERKPYRTDPFRAQGEYWRGRRSG